jgi:HlyD family secretion protein
MKVKKLFVIAIIGIVVAMLSAWFYNVKVKSLAPLSVNYNPYEQGVYASGIIESLQQQGANINIFPEVSGKVMYIVAHDGQKLKKGDLILRINASVQSEIVKKDAALVKAAKSLLDELKAEPRKEILAVSKAQLDAAKANLVNVQAQLEKIKKAYCLDKQSVSKNVLDNAINAVKIAQENLKVARTQYLLTKAGAWSYDISNQESQLQAAIRTYEADKALLEKHNIKAPIDGVILRINTAVGSYVSPQGVYDTYSQTMTPITEMGATEDYMAVRCFLNEILTPRLPEPKDMVGQMFIRGNGNNAIPLEFERIQPYTIPNIELSAERAERVDVRVLPIIFKFKKPKDVNVYAGQLVDVYIRGKK